VTTFTVISTFSGGGGSSLGYTLAGGKILLAVEWDDNAVATYRANFPSTDVYHGDIAQLSVEKIMQRTGIRPGELDILDGSPPCQGFSTQGKRQIGDPRNQLFREYCRILRGLQPRMLVMENVSGMVKGKMRLLFADILRELKSCGYDVKAKLLNSMYYNVPQSRQRMIFVGVRNEMGIAPSHPSPRSNPITVRQAFHGLSDIPEERPQLSPDSKTSQQMLAVAPGMHCKFHFSHKRLHWDRPAPTIDKGGGSGAYHVWHPKEHRPITVSEYKRLGSFPDSFVFIGKVNDAVDRIGNSVPPNFMRAIAEHVRDNILVRCPR